MVGKGKEKIKQGFSSLNDMSGCFKSKWAGVGRDQDARAEPAP